VRCREAETLFAAELAEELQPDARLALEAHLASCAGCARRLSDYGALVACLREEPSVQVRSGFAAGVAARIHAEAPPSSGGAPWYSVFAARFRLAAAAAAILLVAVVGARLMQNGPSPEDATAVVTSRGETTGRDSLPAPAEPDIPPMEVASAGRADSMEDLVAGAAFSLSPADDGEAEEDEAREAEDSVGPEVTRGLPIDTPAVAAPEPAAPPTAAPPALAEHRPPTPTIEDLAPSGGEFGLPETRAAGMIEPGRAPAEARDGASALGPEDVELEEPEAIDDHDVVVARALYGDAFGVESIERVLRRQVRDENPYNHRPAEPWSDPTRTAYDFSFDNTRLSLALNNIEKQTPISIVVTGELDGTVTMTLRGVSPEDALGRLASVCKLVVTPTGDNAYEVARATAQ